MCDMCDDRPLLDIVADAVAAGDPVTLRSGRTVSSYFTAMHGLMVEAGVMFSREGGHHVVRTGNQALAFSTLEVLSRYADEFGAVIDDASVAERN